MFPFLFLLLLTSVSTCSIHAAEPIGLPSLWELPAGQYVESTPAIDAEGNVYVTVSGNFGFRDVSGGKLVSITSKGIKRWAFRAPCDIKSSPAIGDDGTIYFGGRDRKLYAINSQGKLRWTFTTGAWVDASPAIGTNGVIYFGSWDQKFYALNPDGTKRWEFSTQGPVDSSASIANDGTIYFGSHDKKFYALKPDGTVKWNFATEGAILSSPALNCDGSVYFTSVDGKLYALNADGSKKWDLWTGGVHPASPAIDGAGNVYVGVNDTFQAVKPDGTKSWGFGYPPIEGCAAIAADGTVYFGGVNSGVGVLYGFDPKGEIRSYTPVKGAITGSPTIAPDGTIYVGGYNLQAFKGTAALTNSCWPKFRGGPRQTGRKEP